MKTLGISCGLHDSAACLVRDGEILFASAEERYTRKTHDAAFPRATIGEALQRAGLRGHALDAVAFGWSTPFRSALYSAKDYLRTGGFGLFPHGIKQLSETFWHKFGLREFRSSFGPVRSMYLDHHLAHALSSYAVSGFDEATVLVVDGRGAFEASSIWHAQHGRIEPVEIIQWPNSLGLFYQKFTAYLGFVPLSDEWKVMGLAAYGNEGIDLSPFIDVASAPYRIAVDRLYGRELWDIRGIEAVLGPRRKPDEPITQRHKDIAFATQKMCEEAMLGLTRYAISKTRSGNLCLAGGVALNCKANGLLANLPEVSGIFVQPAASDDGTALGAALYPYLLLEGKVPLKPMQHAYLGSSFTAEEIEQELIKYKLKYERPSNPERTIAEYLAAGKILGRFNGRMEFGPRALGNRSILADPRVEEMKDKVNNSVKYREVWRPFAPSMLVEKYDEFFDAKAISPFMILSFPVREEKKDVIPAATHVDGTARPQTVDKRFNESYWNIIDNFYQITGVPVVVNTSFNLKGEPIVRTPYDAIRTFFTSGLDVLALGDFLVYKS